MFFEKVAFIIKTAILLTIYSIFMFVIIVIFCLVMSFGTTLIGSKLGELIYEEAGLPKELCIDILCNDVTENELELLVNKYNYTIKFEGNVVDIDFISEVAEKCILDFDYTNKVLEYNIPN